MLCVWKPVLRPRPAGLVSGGEESNRGEAAARLGWSGHLVWWGCCTVKGAGWHSRTQHDLDLALFPTGTGV